jgi:hypothetical protein
MDGTGAGTGQDTAPGEVADGPARPVGRADATGPLPVQAPADPTGPLPTPQTESWFAPADETAAQPVVPAPPPAAAEQTAPQPAADPQAAAPSWFATGPLPVVPPSPEEVAAAAEAAAPADLFTPAAPAAPGGLFEPATPSQVPGPPPAPAVPPPTLFAAPTPEPATGLFAAVAPADAPAQPPADATGPIPMPAAAPPQAAPPQSAPPPVMSPPAPPPPVVSPPVVSPAVDAGHAPAPEVPAPPAPPAAPLPAFASDPALAADLARDSRPRTPSTAPGHPTGITTVKAGTPRTRRAWPLTVGGVLVAVAAGIALVFSVARTNPADLASTAAADAARWPGVHYQGTVGANDGGEIRVDLTVSPDGAAGTLSRYGGQATAEVMADADGALIRGNREWWLYHHPTRADDLAGVWVAEPATETGEIDRALGMTGEALAAFVRGEEPGQWQALEQQLVEGRSGIVLSDGTRRVVVGGDEAHPLIALDLVAGSSTPPVPVTSATEEQLAAVTGAAARVRQEAAPKTLDQILQERPNVGIQLQPDAPCTAETCNVTITVTNSGTAPARGRLEVTADGNVVATHPLDVPPGQVATFNASAPNPQFSQPGANGRILWETRAVDD